MDNILVAENKVKSLAFSIPNAKEGKEYSQTVDPCDDDEQSWLAESTRQLRPQLLRKKLSKKGI